MMNRLHLIVVSVLLALVSTGSSPSSGSAPSSAKRIDVVAHRFNFQPSEVTLKKGEPVTLVIHSEDVAHGLVIKELNVNVDVAKKGVSEVTFSPATTGTFKGKCAHFCGAGHGSMQFTVQVVDQ